MNKVARLLISKELYRQTRILKDTQADMDRALEHFKDAAITYINNRDRVAELEAALLEVNNG